MTPTKAEQIILNVPTADRDAMVAEAYALFRALPPPSGAVLRPAGPPSPGVDSPAGPSEGSDSLEEMGRMTFKICVAVFVGGILLKILIAAGKKKPKRKIY